MKVGDFNAYPSAPTLGVSKADGRLVNGTQLEILETARIGELTYAKGKILSGSVSKGSTKTRRVGDAVWFAYLKNGVPYRNRAGAQIWKEELIPERLRPDYWQGKVKARLVKRLSLYDAPANLANGQPAGNQKGSMLLNVESVIEFDSQAVLNLTVGDQTLRMASCTLVSGGLWGYGFLPPTFWACVENEQPNKCVIWDTVTPSAFDNVVTTSTSIKAGDPIGYLGQIENLTDEDGGVSSKYQVHVEIFTAEAEIKDFLQNVAGLKTGKQYLYLAVGTELKMKTPATATIVLKKNHSIDLSRTPLIQEGGEYWYEVHVIEGEQAVAGRVKKASAEIITQHDWEKLGFHTVEESNTTADGFLDPDDMPQFFKDVFAKIDSNCDGDVEPGELANALQNADTRNQWTKLVARHPTEWKDKTDSAKWRRLDSLLKSAPKVLRHEKERIDRYAFWDELTGKAAVGSDLVWHFHPIETIRHLSRQPPYIDVEHFIAMYGERHIEFQAGSSSLSEKSKNNLIDIINNINIYIETESITVTRFELAYMLATARHEAYNFKRQEFFSFAPEIGSVAYFDKYDPILADTTARRATAIRMENTVQGDGFKYRGRGLVHLTWKKNYRVFTEKLGIDFVSNPELAAEPKYSVPIMILGMKEGVFSGAKIGSYIYNDHTDYVNARKVINGVDEKELIARYAIKFEEILKSTSIAPERN